MADLRDILSDDDEHVNDEELMKYLEGDVSESEQQSFEEKTVDSSFENDAIEGLQQFKDQQKVKDYVRQLNSNLHQQLASRKARKEKRDIQINPWFLLAVVVVLLLCILAYVVIHINAQR